MLAWFKHRVREAISNFTLLSLLVSLVLPLAIFPASQSIAANTACAANAAAQNSISVEPSHGKVFYIDTGVSPRLDATYVGYRVTNNTGSTISNGWVSLSNFTGGSVTLSQNRDQYAQLPTIANGETKTVYFLLKASVSSKVAQTHTVKVWRGRPDVSDSTNPYICDFSFTKVAETIKAAANKVTNVSIDDSTPELGQLIKITAEGATGTIGDGSPDIGRILWFSPSAFSNFPTSAVKLESVKLAISDNNQISGNGNNQLRFYQDRLLVTPSINPNSEASSNDEDLTTDNLVGKRYYRNEYVFRVVGTTTQGIPVQPVAQISSGTQIKHTDISQTPSANLATNTVSINLTVTKTATIPSPAVTATINNVAYQEVNYSVTVDNTAASGSVTVDEVVDTPANGVLYKANSVRVGGSVAAEPVKLSSESNLSPQPFHFVGPYTVSFNTNLVITYTMYIPTATNTTYSNKAVAYVGSQAVGSSSSAVSSVGVVVSGGSATSATTTNVTVDPVPVTLPASSIGTTTATLNGTVDGNGQTPSAVFEWSTNSNLTSYTTINASDSVAGSDPVAITSSFTGTAGTTYYYRVVAIKNNVRYVGEIQSFTLVEAAAAAVAVTLNASSVQTTSAFLNGSIDPNMQTITQVRFRYGTDQNLAGASTKILYELAEDGTETTTPVQLTGANPIDLQWQLTGLTQGTTYYYRIEGDYNNGSAQTATGSIVSFKPGSLSQTITFAAINDQNFSTGTFDINATASSNLDVTYRSESPSICSVNASTGVVTFLKVGFCAITASQVGNSTYAAAEDVTRQFEILASAPTATTNAATNVAKTTATLNGAITTGGGASTTITFVYSTNSDLSSGTTVTAAQSPLTADGSVTFSLTGLTANTRYYFKVVGQNSNSSVSGSTLDFTTLAPTAASVTAENKSKNYLQATPAFTFTTTGLVNPDTITSVTYTFSKNNADGYDAYGPSTTAPTEAGVYTITPSAAVFGVGNSGDYTITYNTGTYTINKIDQAALSLSGASISQSTTVTLAATGGSGTGSVTYAVTSGTCTVNGTQLTSNATNETCTVTVTKAADRNYNQQTTTANFVVNSNLSQTITFNDPADRNYSSTAFTHNASASSTLTVTMTSNTSDVCTVVATGTANQFSITMLKAGTCSITASQAGGSAGGNTYNAAQSVTQTFLINKASRTIVIKNNSEGAAYTTSYATGGYPSWGDPAPTLKSLASEDDSDAKTYSLAAGSSGCSIAANGVVTFTGAGTCKAKVTITGNRYEDATSADISFTIGKKNQVITFNNPSNMTLGDNDQSLTISTDAQGLNVTITVDPASSAICELVGNAIKAKAAGDCIINTTQGGNNDYNAANPVSKTFTISPANNNNNNGGGGGGGGAPVTPPPAVSSLSKTAVCAVSNDITIFGSNLEGAKVKLDGIDVVIKSEAANALVVTLPAGSLGNKVLTITTAYGSTTATVNYLTASKPKFQPIRIPYLSQGVLMNLDFIADHATSFRLIGRLPSGVTFNSATGLISGTPTDNGVFILDLIAVGPCGETTAILELDVDAPTPNAISHRINFLPGSCTISESAKESFLRFIEKVKGISPRNIIPDIYISGGYKESDPNGPLAQCRQEALCGVLLVEDLLGEVLTDVFSGSEHRIEIIVYWERPTDDEI